ncbi:hypothetical protein [Corynebacterium pelargi]|uniref:Uncharacterized protein n=1 Tax=Corynebacterium pelargi TaxID=1471400 RepID=A0A410WAY1_9CORY|nr:hypothetical protein [Corynebacterium pelargi]QAU53107.1 hypothetical protein CPELA_09260 [Corynebacterium pelargi]GGG74829.1 hypothetical protein GCM10007338_10310 [Corynebacterium pelargi]
MCASNLQHINDKGYLRLFVNPLLVSFVVFAIIPGIFAALFGLVLPYDENHLVNLPSAAAM